MKKNFKKRTEAKNKGHLGSKNGFFCLAEMGQKTLWVSDFERFFGVISVKTPNLFLKP